MHRLVPSSIGFNVVLLDEGFNWSSVLNVFALSLDFAFNVFHCHLLFTHRWFLVFLLSPWQRQGAGWWRLFGFLSLSSFEHVRGGNTEMCGSRSVWRPLSCYKAVREWVQLSSGSSEMFPRASSSWWAVRGRLWMWKWSLVWTRGSGQLI